MAKKSMMYIVAAIMALFIAGCSATKELQETTAQALIGQGEERRGMDDKVPDPNVEPMEIVSVYGFNTEKTGLLQAMDAIEQLDAQSLADKLMEYGVLDTGTNVLSFDMVQGVGTLNLSQLPKVDNQEALVTAIANTFIENYELQELELLIKGEPYSTKNNSGLLKYNPDYDKIKEENEAK